MTYHGVEIVHLIDNMDGLDAGWYFAGVAGVNPKGLTLRSLYRMACAKTREARSRIVETLTIKASEEPIDINRYIEFGELAESIVGKPLELSPENEAKVQAEIERIRQENPGLPTIPSIAS